MALQGYLLQAEVDTEVVCAYAASQQQVPAVAAAPGWYKIGAFYLPKDLKCRLDVIAFVSAVGLTGTARLYDPTAGTDAPVSGSDISFTNLTDARSLSGSFSLVGNRTYLIQVQGVGAAGPTKFVVLNTASLVGP